MDKDLKDRLNNAIVLSQTMGETGNANLIGDALYCIMDLEHQLEETKKEVDELMGKILRLRLNKG